MKTISGGKIDPSIKEVLRKLVTIDLDYLVAGGLLCQYYLKDHARFTKDVDIVFYEDQKVIEEKLNKAFGTISFTYSEGTNSFYEANFTCLVKVNDLRGQVEGKRIGFFPKIRVEQYSYEGITFKGVCIEYVIAEKLVSILNELHRPYKHLVDIYSFSKIDQSLIDKKEIIRYVSLINAQENEYRKKVGLKEINLPRKISDDKVLNPPIIVPTLQSKYNIAKEEMIREVNEWLETLL